MKVIVCGGRNWTDTKATYAFLDRINKRWPIDVIIEGDARGADRMAGYWARKNKIENRKYPADWGTHGRAAGPIRNQEMLDKEQPGLVVAFPGGRGTADMVNRAHQAGIRVEEWSSE